MAKMAEHRILTTVAEMCTLLLNLGEICHFYLFNDTDLQAKWQKNKNCFPTKQKVISNSELDKHFILWNDIYRLIIHNIIMNVYLEMFTFWFYLQLYAP